MKQMQIFSYNGNSITFELANGDVMVNAIEIARPFDKNPKDFSEWLKHLNTYML